MTDHQVSAVFFMDSDDLDDLVEERGYTHDLYRIRLTNTSLDDSLPTPYVIKHNGVALEPEEVIECLRQSGTKGGVDAE